MKVYIARDKDDNLYLYNHKPSKNNLYGYECWDSPYDFFQISETDLPEGINPQWEDNEPIKVNLKIEKI